MLLTAAMFLTMILSACGNNSSSEANGKVTLTLFSTMSNSGGERKAFEEVIREFEKEHQQIRIDANFPGNSYEDMIRVKMGANDMPDLFDTWLGQTAL
ncbi:hypothetical protein BsIDN1_34550 [Bacillus safensis]|uniref:Extracellular solute-binding protein n=1 Tax=Bacillus safensis TaxID=561879 RepID=A0A5S9M8K8_BACIA|nr:hypothetical protein BsIDN1_34550 [Bacillus safensis]